MFTAVLVIFSMLPLKLVWSMYKVLLSLGFILLFYIIFKIYRKFSYSH